MVSLTGYVSFRYNTHARTHAHTHTHTHTQLTTTLVPELFPCPPTVETRLISLCPAHTRHTGQRISILLEKGHLLGELFFCICSVQPTQRECPQGSTHHCTQERGRYRNKHTYIQRERERERTHCTLDVHTLHSVQYNTLNHRQ